MDAENITAHQRSHALEAALRTPGLDGVEAVLAAAGKYLTFLQNGPQQGQGTS